MKLKVLQINGSFYRRGGADVVFINTIDALKKRGHEVVEFAAAHSRNHDSRYVEFFAKETSIRHSNVMSKLAAVGPFLYNSDAAARLSLLIKRERPDIAHIHLFYGALSGSILNALTAMAVPIVVTVHDYRLLCPAYMFLDGRNKICERCLDGRFIHCAVNRCSAGSLSQSMVLTAEAYLRKYAINPKKLVRKFVFVSDFSFEMHAREDDIYRRKGVLLHNFLPDTYQAPAVHQGGYFLYYGRLSREKGIATAIKASQAAGVSLYVVGEGDQRANLEKDAGPLVSFLGHREGEDLRALISGCSFVIVPSEWYENNPLVILESYGLGKPVIAARIGGIPEIVAQQNTGYLFAPGDSDELAELLRAAARLMPSEYRRMSLAARRYVEENLGEEEHVSRLEGIYSSVLN